VLAHSAGRDAVIDLEVELERCDEDAISYSGVATMDSIRLMSLGGCDAPMLPLDQFDDPASMQRQLEMLLSGGGVLAAFDPELTDAIPLEAFAHIQGGMQSEIVAPPAGPFYADHFPRRAVLPATLLLDAAIRLTRRVAELTNYAAIPLDAPISVRDVKLRAFIDPGDRLQLAVVQVPSESPAMDFAMTAVRDERRVATARISMAGS